MYTQRRVTPGGTPIPDNYAGNAFRYPPIGSLQSEQQITHDGVPPSDEAQEKDERPLVFDAPSEARREEAPDIERHGQASPLLPLPLLGGHSFGNEELLLVGLFLLLAGDGVIGPGRDKDKSDLLLYLLLLFFCG